MVREPFTYSFRKIGEKKLSLALSVTSERTMFNQVKLHISID